MKRGRYFRYPFLLCAALLVALVGKGAEPLPATGELFVYVGTYTKQESKGIYAYRFQPTTRKLASIGLVGETDNPSFLTFHPNHRFLYAVNEGKPGSVTAFSIDAPTGRLTLLNRVNTRGSNSCHLSVDRTGRCLLVADYGSGSVAAFPVKEDGSLGEASAFVQHSGSSIGRFQKGPHPHMVLLSPDNRFVFVPDLGLDQVVVYRLDPAKATITLNDPPFVRVTQGSGPRHMAFHPKGQFAYVNSEMGSIMTAFAYTPASGSLKELQTISTLPKDFTETNYTAAVEVHPNGRFLYVSNRGHDSVAVFTIDARKGTLTFVEHVSTQGQFPRNIAIDPTGAYLFAANMNSNNMVLFRIDQKTGRLTPTGENLNIPSPVCVIFRPAQ